MLLGKGLGPRSDSCMWAQFSEGHDLFFNFVMVQPVGDKAGCPLLPYFEREAFLFLEYRSVVGVKVMNLLNRKVYLRISTIWVHCTHAPFQACRLQQ